MRDLKGVAGAAEHERELLEDRVRAGLLLYNPLTLPKNYLKSFSTPLKLL